MAHRFVSGVPIRGERRFRRGFVCFLKCRGPDRHTHNLGISVVGCQTGPDPWPTRTDALIVVYYTIVFIVYRPIVSDVERINYPPVHAAQVLLPHMEGLLDPGGIAD